jgi:hypothetical protein
LGIPNTNLIAFYHKGLALAAKASPYCKNILRMSISSLKTKENLLSIVRQEQSRLVLWVPEVMAWVWPSILFWRFSPPYGCQ